MFDVFLLGELVGFIIGSFVGSSICLLVGGTNGLKTGEFVGDFDLVEGGVPHKPHVCGHVVRTSL